MIKFLFATAVLVGAAFGYYTYIFVPSPAGVSQNFWTAVAKQNKEQAAVYMLDGVIQDQALHAVIGWEAQGSASWSGTNDGNQASIPTVLVADGEVYELDTYLRYQDGRWQVDLLATSSGLPGSVLQNWKRDSIDWLQASTAAAADWIKGQVDKLD